MEIIVLDTSVLINFLNIRRLNLFAAYPATFIITEDVLSEIGDHYPSQKKQIEIAITQNILSLETITQLPAIQLFARLSEIKRLGLGECSAIAYAISQRYALAVDDIRAIKQAKKIAPDLTILTTETFILYFLKIRVLTLTQAKQIKNEWQQSHRYLLKLAFEEMETITIE